MPVSRHQSSGSCPANTTALEALPRPNEVDSEASVGHSPAAKYRQTPEERIRFTGWKMVQRKHIDRAIGETTNIREVSREFLR